MVSVFDFSLLSICLLLLPVQDQGQRALEYNGQAVPTTYWVDNKFLGKYSGAGKGYLVLRDDGTGSYRYDYHITSSGSPCPDGEIAMKWGFVTDGDGGIVRFERPYGYSYPIIFVCTGSPSFQSCTSDAMVDYILEYHDGHLGVSSSDDWRKTP